MSLAIRDSKYVSILVGSDIIDGVELSRKLKHREIRYGVVKGLTAT